jgi:hypothetical protein
VEAREALLARVSAADGTTEIKDPATGEVIGRHTYGTPADVTAPWTGPRRPSRPGRH